MIQPGERFPDFEIAGKATLVLRSQSPLVILFWRIGCSTSRLALPFFGRLADAYPNARVVAVGQESSDVLGDYVEATGQSVACWADADLAASRSFGVEVLPTWFLTDSTGAVLDAGVAWNRDRIEDLSGRLARMTGAERVQIVRQDDGVPDFKPG